MAFLNIPPKDNSTPLTAVEFNYLVDKLNARQLNDLIDVQSDDAVDKNIIQHNGSGWVFAKITDNHFTKTEIIALINGVDVSIPVDTYIERFFITDGTTINTINNADTITFNSSQFTINPTTGEIELDAVGNASDWDTAYDKNILSIAVTGTTTKTITLTQRDGSTLTGTFQDLSGAGGDGNDFLTSGSFDDTDGVITLNVANQSPVTVDIDGRFSLIGHSHVISDITGLQTALNGKVDDSQVLTNVPVGAVFTDTVYDDSTIQSEVDANTLKVGITPAQAQDIVDNNAKVSNVDHPLVETAVPVGAVFTDTQLTQSQVGAFATAEGFIKIGSVTNLLSSNNTWTGNNYFQGIVEIDNGALGANAGLGMSNHKIQFLGNGVIATDAVNKGQLDGAIANLLVLDNTWAGENTFNEDTRFLNEIFVTGDVTTTNAYIENAIQFNLGSGTINLSRTSTTDGTNWFLKLPRANGQLAVSVQGNVADAFGNIVVPNMVLTDADNTFTGTNTFQDETVFSSTVLIEGVEGLSMEGGKISNLADGTLTTDAVNKGQMDSAIAVINNNYIRSNANDDFTGFIYATAQGSSGLRLNYISNALTPVTATSGSYVTGGADFAGLGKINNVAIQTWYGFSVSPTISGYTVPQGSPAFSVDARNGNAYIHQEYYANGNKVLHAGNHTDYTDAKYLRSDVATTKTAGNLRMATGVPLYFGTTIQGLLQTNGASEIMMNLLDSNFVIRNNGATRITFDRSSGSINTVGAFIGTGTGDSRVAGGFAVGDYSYQPQAKLTVTDYTAGTNNVAFFKGQGINEGEATTISINNGYSSEYRKEVKIGAVAEAGSSNLTGMALYTSPTSAGSVERVRIDSAGNVGVGTTNPTYKLDINGRARFTDEIRAEKFVQIPEASTTVNEGRGVGYLFSDDFANEGNDSVTRYLNHYGFGIHKPKGANVIGGRGAYMSGYFGVDIFTQGANRIHVGQNGKIGMGTTSPNSELHIERSTGTANVAIDAYNSGSSYGGQGNLEFLTEQYGTANIYFGRRGAAQSAHLGKINWQGSGSQIAIYAGSTTVPSMIFNSSSVTTTLPITASDFILNSDARLKENVKSFTEDDYVKVDFKTYNLKDNKGLKRVGVIANELEIRNPELVRTDENGVKSVAYFDLLIAKVAELEARLAKLEN